MPPLGLTSFVVLAYCDIIASYDRQHKAAFVSVGLSNTESRDADFTTCTLALTSFQSLLIQGYRRQRIRWYARMPRARSLNLASD